MIVGYPTLKNAPITEALIDIRVKLPSSLDTGQINSIHDAIKEQYPDKQEQRVSEFKFEPKAEVTVKSSEAKIHGFRYLTSDKKQIVQTRIDGFTFSRLHPYITWTQLRDEARRLWKIYTDITSPELIYRVAVRYINNLNIPMPIDDFGDYLVSPPVVPDNPDVKDKLPQGISSFLNRIVLPKPEINSHAIITQALETIIDTNKSLPIILDIDAIYLNPDGFAEDYAWNKLEELRYFKNEIFFNSITKKLLEQYE